MSRMDLNVAWLKKGARPAGKYLADWVQRRVLRGVPNIQGKAKHTHRPESE